MSRFSTRLCLSLVLAWSCLTGDITTAQQPAAPAAAKEVDVLIGFKTPPGRKDHELVTKQGGKIKHSYWIVNAVAARLPEQALAAIQKNPNVSVIESDAEVTAHDLELDNAWGVQRIGSEFAHTGGYGGAGVKVAVLDSGIDYNHPDLNDNYQGGWDFVNNDDDPMDDNGHGTHVAGTIAAEDNGVGVVGVAPHAKLYALKVLNASGSGSFSGIIAAVQWCVENGIHVTNNSYGSSSYPGSIVRDAYDNADALGLVMVASAGNSGNSSGTGDNVGYPAAFDSVIAVAATTSGEVRASYSSTGPAVEIAAPGSGIYSTTRGGGYGNKSGTSMASPHMAGAAAVLIGGGLTLNDDVRLVLAMTSVDLGASGVDPWYGYGRVDLAEAVATLEGPPPEPDPTPEPTPEPTPDPPPAGIASVDWIAYSTFGGKRSDKHLTIEVAVVNEYGAPIPNASVAVLVARNGSIVESAETTTDGAGIATFTLNSAKSGDYQTLVTDVWGDGFEWDGASPANSFSK